jgi:hypothetical protein
MPDADSPQGTTKPVEPWQEKTSMATINEYDACPSGFNIAIKH